MGAPAIKRYSKVVQTGNNRPELWLDVSDHFLVGMLRIEKPHEINLQMKEIQILLEHQGFDMTRMNEIDYEYHYDLEKWKFTQPVKGEHDFGFPESDD